MTNVIRLDIRMVSRMDGVGKRIVLSGREEGNRIIYLDNAATTSLSPGAFEAMSPWLTKQYANPSTLYSFGKAARKAVEQARAQMASCLNCDRNQVIFTSGGTESDNMAIRGAAQLGAAKGKRHIITSAFEHSAVLNTCKLLQLEGFRITYLPVTSDGMVSLKELSSAIRDDTALVSIMTVNNELGTVQPIKAIAEIAHAHGALFHTDAVQAACHIPIDVKMRGVDLLSLSAHKFHGPKGVGALVCTVPDLPPLIYGGGQEHGLRSGSENVAGIVGMAAVMNECNEDQHGAVLCMKSHLVNLLGDVPSVYFNGGSDKSPTGILNVRVDGVEGEALLLMLDKHGICVSAGSACSSVALEGSHVLRAIGLNRKDAHSSIRVSIDYTNTIEEIEEFAETFTSIIERLR